MKWRTGHTTIIGLFLLAIAIVLFCSDPDLIFSEGVSFIDTELEGESGHETYTWSKVGFKHNEELLNFPEKIGEWEGYGSDEKQVAGVREYLGARVYLERTYYKIDSFNPIFFLIVQAKESSTFHPPPVCYQAQGYIVEEDKDTVRIPSAQLEGDGISGGRVGGTVPMKKLWLSKIEGGEVVERRIALYCYLKGSQFTDNTINLIRFSAIAPVEGSPDGVLQGMKEFAGLALPHLFEPQENGDEVLFQRVAGWGPEGWLVITAAFTFPITLTIYPLWRRKA